MMTEGSTTEETTTEMTTTAPVENPTTGSDMTSSWSRGVDFYFQCAVVVIGVVGTAANALVVYALAASKEHRKHALIFNQNLLDLVCCFFLVVTYSAKLVTYNVYLAGARGYWLCLTLLSEGFVWCPNVGSMINLAAITVERYLKIVHHGWSKKRLKKWMTYSAIAFAWIAGVIVTAGVTIPTTDVVDGLCYAQIFWKSQGAQMAYGIWYFYPKDPAACSLKTKYQNYTANVTLFGGDVFVLTNHPRVPSEYPASRVKAQSKLWDKRRRCVCATI